MKINCLIFDKFGNHVENMKGFQKIIDSYFDIVKFQIKKSFYEFILFFVVPLNIQLFVQTKSEEKVLGSWIVRICMIICFFRYSYLITTEIIQISKQKLKEYFSSFWNYIDVFNIFTFLVYFFYRMTDTKCVIPDVTTKHEFEIHQPGQEKGIEEYIYRDIFWVLLNSLIIFQTALKCQYYFKVYEQFNHMVMMIGMVIKNMRLFVFYFLIWVFTLSILLKITGMEILKRDMGFPVIDDYVGNFIRSFRNSIGDISSPAYKYWASYANESPEYWA